MAEHVPIHSLVIDVVGLGIAQPALLSAEAQAALKNANLVIGSERQLALVAELHGNQTCELPKLAELKQQLAELADNHVVILASGDPLLFGIGRWIKNNFSAQRIQFHPAISSLQAACHRLGLSLQDCEMVSLHGRSVESIRRVFRDQQTLLLLTDKNSHPQRLAQECLSAGYDHAEITVLSDLGYDHEKQHTYVANELVGLEKEFPELHVTVIQTKGIAHYLPQFPGIEDQHFITEKENGKGLITKREVRLAALSLLQPSNGDIGWDIGAGCGGLAVEWAYWNKDATLYGIENNQQRFACLEKNIQRFGVSQNLNAIAGKAPAALDTLPQANKVFIGGSGGELENLLQLAWQQLPLLDNNRSMLVASAVTEESKQTLLRFYRQLKAQAEQNTNADNRYRIEIETLQVAVNKGEALAGQLIYRPNLPVSLFRFEKIALRNNDSKGHQMPENKAL